LTTKRHKFPGPPAGGRWRSADRRGLLWDKQSGRILGGALVGPNAGDLIAEIGFAIEMGADAADIGLTVHPHPTLSETVAFAAEAYEGTLTDLYMPKKR
jgi:dihydrolipoamide dehydrogenase